MESLTSMEPFHCTKGGERLFRLFKYSLHQDNCLLKGTVLGSVYGTQNGSTTLNPVLEALFLRVY